MKHFSITFEALTDKLAVDFLRDFINLLPGYVIVNNLELRRGAESYGDDALVKISNGEFLNLVSGKIDFSWYYIRPRQ